MRRAFCLVAGLCPGLAGAEAFSDFGRPEQCGTYAEVSYDRDSYFPGGEAGLLSLTNPQAVQGLNVLLADAIVSEEGMADPAGRVMAVRAPLLVAEGAAASDVLVVVTEAGIRLLQPCR